MFEVHITIHPLAENEIESFVEFCRSIDAKPIIIELEKGEVLQQPMISKIYKELLSASLKSKIKALSLKFHKAGYSISRVKVEVPLNYIENGLKEFPLYKGQYFEWHGKIQFEDFTQLRNKLTGINAHLSSNSLKGQKDRRFLTFRYNGVGKREESAFIKGVEKIKSKLREERINLLKDEYECCIFDSNKSIDKGWIDTPETTNSNHIWNY